MLEFTHLPIQDGTAIGILTAPGHDGEYRKVIDALNHRLNEGLLLAIYEASGESAERVKSLVNSDVATLRVFHIDREGHPRNHSRGPLHLILVGIDEDSECVAGLSFKSWTPLNLYHPPNSPN